MNNCDNNDRLMKFENKINNIKMIELNKFEKISRCYCKFLIQLNKRKLRLRLIKKKSI